jgi:hypothetical protein
VLLSSAVRTFLMAERMRVRIVLLRACALRLVISLFLDDFNLGTLELL